MRESRGGESSPWFVIGIIIGTRFEGMDSLSLCGVVVRWIFEVEKYLDDCDFEYGGGEEDTYSGIKRADDLSVDVH